MLMWPTVNMSLTPLVYLYVTEPSSSSSSSSSSGLSVLREIVHQHGGEHAHSPVQLALPEAVVRLRVAAQQADHRALVEGELLVRLALVVVECADEYHCKERGIEREKERER